MKIFRHFVFVCALAFCTALASKAEAFPQQQVPFEYQKLKQIVDRLAKANDLGDRPFYFSIVGGDAAKTFASELRLCDYDECNYYASLNPYRAYGGKIDEVLRQAYLHGHGQFNAYASPTGTISIAREVFRLYGKNDNYLACLVAHELSHFLDAHTFAQEREQSAELQGKTDDQQKVIRARFERQYEHYADQRAADMTVRAGYEVSSCVDETEFMLKLSGSGSHTQADSTHPGFDDRIDYLKSYVQTDQFAEQIKSAQSTRGEWRYDSSVNYLMYRPLR